MAVGELHITSTSLNNHHRPTTNMSSNSGTTKRSSFFGSIKKLGRSSSTKMGKPEQTTNATMGNSSSSTPSSRNPFSNPSTATRRPPTDAAPPSYIEALSGPSVAPTTTFPSSSSAARRASPAPSGASAALSIGSYAITTEEDPYAFLSTFDTVFLIDDSGSMAGASWRETRDVLRNIAPVCAAHDADGIDVYFLNTRNNGPGTDAAGGFLNIRDGAAVNRLFETVHPNKATPTGTRLQNILRPYVKNLETQLAKHGGDAEAAGVKPMNVIVITDGVPTDDPESVLLGFAKKLDKMDAPPYQLGIQFFQVGNEPGAKDALQELDDNLGKEAGKGVRDMVDTTTWNGQSGSRSVLTADGILKAVLGAVVKRLDRRRISVEVERRDRLRP